MRNLRLLSVLFAALALTLALAAGSAARSTSTSAAPALPQPATSQPAPPALATSPSATQRSFVSGLGSDANPCTRTAPCRNFAKAISETLADGEVIVLDSAGYGPFTVDKSIDIIAPAGVYAGVTAFSGDAITVAAAATDRVVLRGLTLNGLGGNAGILVSSVGELFVQQVTMKKFGYAGLYVGTTTTPRVFVENSVAHDNYVGLFFGTGVTHAAIDGARVERNDFGLVVYSGAKVTARDSLAAGNMSQGFFASYAGTELNLERALSTENGTGIDVSSSAIVRISETMVTNNGVGLDPAGGSIVSWGTNRVAGNTTNGAPTSTIPQV